MYYINQPEMDRMMQGQLGWFVRAANIGSFEICGFPNKQYIERYLMLGPPLTTRTSFPMPACAPC